MSASYSSVFDCLEEQEGVLADVEVYVVLRLVSYI